MLLYSLLVTQYYNFINKMKVFTIIISFFIYKYFKITNECTQNIFFKELEKIRAVKRRRRRANNISIKYETSLFTKMRLHVSTHF